MRHKLLDVKHPHRTLWFAWLQYAKRYAHLDPNLGDPEPSPIPIDIVVPCLDKDIKPLPIAIQAARENVLHPIKHIFIVAPGNSKEIMRFCDENDCTFIDESKVAPIKKSQLNYKPRGIDRSGWIFQQLIKLSVDSFTESENVLLLDADTVFIRPQTFIRGNKPVFDHSDEHHEPYYRIFHDLTATRVSIPLSFVAHHMLINSHVLAELRAFLENKHGEPWYQAILGHLAENELSSFSEYELYGNYFCSVIKRKCVHEYWFNIDFPPSKISELDSLIQLHKSRTKSLSFHSYISE